MLTNLIHKAYANSDVIAGYGVSGALTSTPLWLTPATDFIQFITLLIGAAVGISAYRLNTARRREIEKQL